jgi:nucleoside-diphosphate-sugar epimerase
MNTPFTPTSPTSPRTVLILGANGRLGLATAQAFDAAGWQVLAQVRREAAPGLPATARVLRQSPAELLAQATHVGPVHAVLHALNPPYTRWATEALPQARSAMDLAQALGARLLFPGNVYNFGAQMPALLRADTPQTAQTRKGRIRINIEAELQARCAAGQLQATVLRAGDFFGSGSGNWFDLVIAKDIAKGKLVYPGPLDRAHAWAYLPDLARAFVAVAQPRDRPAFEALHFAGHTLTGAQLLTALTQAAHDVGLAPAGPMRQGTLPWALVRLGGWVWPQWRELAEMAYLWKVPHALDDARLSALGLPATTPINAALQQALLALPLRGHAAHTPAHTTA